jgi:hypothetical protein
MSPSTFPPLFLIEKLKKRLPKFYETIGNEKFWGGLITLTDDEKVIKLTEKILKILDETPCSEAMAALLFTMIIIYNYVEDLKEGGVHEYVG